MKLWAIFGFRFSWKLSSRLGGNDDQEEPVEEAKSVADRVRRPQAGGPNFTSEDSRRPLLCPSPTPSADGVASSAHCSPWSHSPRRT